MNTWRICIYCGRIFCEHGFLHTNLCDDCFESEEIDELERDDLRLEDEESRRIGELV